METKESVIVHTRTVSCDGSDAELGHPTVYLTFKDGARETVCPYCSCHFVLSDDAKSTAH